MENIHGLSYTISSSMKPFALSVLFALGFSLIFFSISKVGWNSTWNHFKLPAGPIPFLDMRTVQWAPATKDSGSDPQLTSVGDPFKRAMNYPMVWESVSRIVGLQNEKVFLAFEITLVTLYLVCVFFLVLKTRSLWLLASVFSGASLLAIERGNNDLVVFIVLFLLGLRLSPLFFSAGIFILFHLKIYPVFAAAPILKWKRAILPFFLILLLSSALIWDQLWKIRAFTPLSTGLAYGASSFTWYLKGLTGRGIHPLLVRMILILFGLLLSSLPWFKNHFKVRCHSERFQVWFFMGAGIFLCTFLLSSNFDYRLIMLLLCFPYLLCIETLFARALTLAAVVLSMNYPLLAAWLGPSGIFINFLAKAFLFSIVEALFIQEFLALPLAKTVTDSVAFALFSGRVENPQK